MEKQRKAFLKLKKIIANHINHKNHYQNLFALSCNSNKIENRKLKTGDPRQEHSGMTVRRHLRMTT
jgi:hypothetical protein